MKVKRPYHLDTETLSAFYETIEEALQAFNYWKQFYIDNAGKYGTHEITVTKGKHKIESIVIIPVNC